ncbi:MAG: VWA domain-containing protein, partial [Thermoplasmata archaeon]|nr:VWA domain-containing protein [Thermoplasmata archaeon]
MVEHRRINKGAVYTFAVILIAVMMTSSILALQGPSSGTRQTPPHLVVGKSVSPTTIYKSGVGSPDVSTVTLTVTGAGSPVSQRIAIDMVFSIDSSGSMDWNDPSDIRLQASKNVVDSMDNTIDRVGVCSWDSNIDWKYALTTNFGDAKNKIDTIDHSGGTSLNAGLQGAIEIMDGGAGGGYPCIIFLTDGDCLPAYYTWSGSPGSWVDNAAAKGYVIYAIGLNPPTGAIPKLQDIADNTGGSYFIATTAGDLIPIFDAIATSVMNIAGRNVQVWDILATNIVYNGNPSIAPDVIMGQNIIWDVGEIKIGDTWTVTFDIKATAAGLLPVDAYPASKVYYTDYDDNPVSVSFPLVNINVIGVPPIADFTWTSTTPNEADLVQFTDLSTDPDPGGFIVSWDWDFGDGTPHSAVQHPTYIYGDEGVFTVTLKVTDNDGLSDSVSKRIT